MIARSMSHGTHSFALSYDEDEISYPEPTALEQIIYRVANDASKLWESQILILILFELQVLRGEGATSSEVENSSLIRFQSGLRFT